jgi:hypothetical protein
MTTLGTIRKKQTGIIARPDGEGKKGQSRAQRSQPRWPRDFSDKKKEIAKCAGPGNGSTKRLSLALERRQRTFISWQR